MGRKWNKVFQLTNFWLIIQHHQHLLSLLILNFHHYPAASWCSFPLIPAKPGKLCHLVNVKPLDCCWLIPPCFWTVLESHWLSRNISTKGSSTCGPGAKGRARVYRNLLSWRRHGEISPTWKRQWEAHVAEGTLIWPLPLKFWDDEHVFFRKVL